MKQFNMDLSSTKRSIVNYCKSLTERAGRVQSKFVADMVYGCIASGSTILADIARALQEPIHLSNTIDRLSLNLSKALSPPIEEAYARHVCALLGSRPLLLVDDSDVCKPHGRMFESLALVRDGSSQKNKYQPGYQCTEIVGLTLENRQPISLFSSIYSSEEKDFVSVNRITDDAIRELAARFPEGACFVFDRGYDRQTLYELFHTHGHQRFIVRIKDNRYYEHKGQCKTAAMIAAAYKGKYGMHIQRWNRDKNRMENQEVSVSACPVRVPHLDMQLYMVLVYRVGMPPMYLLTNMMVKSKAACRQIVGAYTSRWRIEEYFRFKKQCLGFERFRVRSLQAIRNLNRILTYATGWLAGTARRCMFPSHFSSRLIQYGQSLRTQVTFVYYQLHTGTQYLLGKARSGIRKFFPRRKPPNRVQSIFAYM